MSLKSRGRSPGGSGGGAALARHAEVAARGGSLGPGHAGEARCHDAVMTLEDSATLSYAVSYTRKLTEAIAVQCKGVIKLSDGDSLTHSCVMVS